MFGKSSASADQNTENAPIEKAITVLKNGGIVVYPTDTAYAIGCSYDNEAAIEQIMKLKGRTDEKFTLIASSGYQVEKFFNLNSAERRLAKKYWPGPLSIVVSKRFSIRVPNSLIATALADAVGKPIIATSCNVTGQETVYDLATRNENADFNALLTKVEAGDAGFTGGIVDVGALTATDVSTVVEVNKNQCVIHRAGAVAVDEKLISE